MRLLMFSRMPRSAKGGVETVFEELSLRLRSRGHHVDLFYRDATGQSEPQSNGGVYARTLPPLRTWKGIPRPVYLLHFLISLFSLNRLLKTLSPQIIHAHYIDGHSLPLVLLKPFHRYKLVLTAHGSDLLRLHEQEHYTQMLVPFIIMRCDLVTCVSHALAATIPVICPRYRGNICVIPNGIDPALWNTNTVNGFDCDQITLVAAGTLHPVKGYDIAIQALSILRNVYPHLKLIIAGVGPSLRSWMEQTRQLQLQDNVSFVGRLSHEELKAIFSSASLFISPSRSEGFGLAVLEAMATGLPVVASRVGGLPDIIEDGISGVLIERDDPKALADALICLLADTDRLRSMSHAARRRAEQFSWDSAVSQYERSYSSVLISASSA